MMDGEEQHHIPKRYGVLQLAFRGRLVGSIWWRGSPRLTSRPNSPMGREVLLTGCSHCIPAQMPDCVAKEIGRVITEVC